MGTQFPFILFFICSILLLLQRWWRSEKTSIKYPPSPPALPIIGHMHLLSSVVHKSFQNLASRYGPFLFIRVGATRSYVVSSSSIAKEIFQTHDVKFATRPDFVYSDSFLYKDTLFSTLDYDTYYKFLKKICMTELLSPKQVNRYGDIRKEEMMELLGVLVKHSESGQACDLGLLTISMTHNMLSRTAWSKRCSGEINETNEIREVAKGITLVSGQLFLGEVLGPFKRFDIFGTEKRIKDLLKRFDALMDRIIEEHDHQKTRAGGKRERKDMIDVLLQIADDQTAEMKLTRHGIKALCLDLFLAGTDTVSIGLQWAIAELLNHPRALQKLKEEILQVVGSTRLIEDSDIPNLPHLQAIIKETLRLHPSLPLVFRRCREDCEINGYKICKNSRMVINLYAINRDPNVWKDASEFLPERFLNSSVENHSMHHDGEEGTKVQNFDFVPFGGGRRGCPGSVFATSVLHLTVGALIQCFDWEIKGADKIDTEEGAGFSAALVQPLLCYPIMRLNPLEIA